MSTLLNPADAASLTAFATRLQSRFQMTRELTTALVAPLSAEDCAIQSMPDVSPTRWHLAHTSWFFETFVLKQLAGFRPYHQAYEYLFNSYYNGVGRQYPRDRRGLLSRPSLEEILEYRRHVDQRMCDAFGDGRLDANLLHLVRLGIEHEQQHQELILTDIKHVLGCNPLFPAYHHRPISTSIETAVGGASALNGEIVDGQFIEYEEGLLEIGYADPGEGGEALSNADFCFDNEQPRHKVYLNRYEIADRCVTNADFLAFIEDGGYRRPEFWLSMGWQAVCENDWQAPLYWYQTEQGWQEFTLGGLLPLVEQAPVCHVSYFEADAFARWSGARLPTEAEWESASRDAVHPGSFVDHLVDAGVTIHPQPSRWLPSNANGYGTLPITQMLGDVWEWTASQYLPYPGFAPSPGAIGEYNGKFMCNQFVLRGGSCATSSSHIRPTYRNFFPPTARWQFSGIRLARS